MPFTCLYRMSTVTLVMCKQIYIFQRGNGTRLYIEINRLWCELKNQRHLTGFRALQVENLFGFIEQMNNIVKTVVPSEYRSSGCDCCAVSTATA